MLLNLLWINAKWISSNGRSSLFNSFLIPGITSESLQFDLFSNQFWIKLRMGISQAPFGRSMMYRRQVYLAMTSSIAGAFGMQDARPIQEWQMPSYINMRDTRAFVCDNRGHVRFGMTHAKTIMVWQRTCPIWYETCKDHYGLTEDMSLLVWDIQRPLCFDRGHVPFGMINAKSAIVCPKSVPFRYDRYWVPLREYVNGWLYNMI